MICKAVYFFGMGDAGWSETFYIRDVASVREAVGRARTVADSRVRLLSNEADLRAVRVSDVAVRGAAILDESVATAGKATAPTKERDIDTVAVRMHISAGGGNYWRQVWIRGVPDNFVTFATTTSREVFSSLLIDPTEGWMRAMNENAFSMRVILKDAPPGANPPSKITDLRVENATGRTIVTAPGSVVQAGVDNVRIYGAKFTTPVTWKLNKAWRAQLPFPGTVLAGGEFIIDMQGPGGAAPNFRYIATTGLVQHRTVDYIPFDGWYYDFFTNRKTRSTFFGRRGRLSKQKPG